MTFLVLQSSREERADCFTFIILMSRGCYCSLSLPHGTMGLSAVCDRDIHGHAQLLFEPDQISVDDISRRQKSLLAGTSFDSRSYTENVNVRGTSFVDLFCVCVLCFSCFRVCLLLHCGHCWERADLLALVGDVYCIFVTFPCGILCQVWYLIVSFPDLCRLSYLDDFPVRSHIGHCFTFVCTAYITQPKK